MSDFNYDRWGPLSFPVYYGGPFYRLWADEKSQFVLASLATIVILLLFRNFCFFVWGFIKPSKLQQYCHCETGSWALVTGASDGIGREFANELLDRGFNVLLHGRNESKLQGIQSELIQKFSKRSIDIVVADASRGDNPENAVVDKVNSLPGKLIVLVNNVGGAPPAPGYKRFSDMTQENADIQINMNARFPTQLTRALLPQLLENKPALILNMGSVASVFGIPYITTYASAKASNLALTLALRNELISEEKANDVEVMGFVIANVLSAGNKGNVPFLTLTANECARGCLARVGSGKTLAYASWRHAVQVEISSRLPERWLRSMILPEMKKRMTETSKEQ